MPTKSIAELQRDYIVAKFESIERSMASPLHFTELATETAGFLVPVENPAPVEIPLTIEIIKPRENLFAAWHKKRPFPPKKKTGALAAASDALFYVAILVILITALFSSGGSGAPKMLMGYSYFTVLTSSMQDEIPKGSFILVHKTEADTLKIGDNITYMRDQSTSVTHQIIGIQENYKDSGERGFITKGVNNENPDSDIVFAGNVVGKVVVSLPGVGAAVSYMRSNIYIVFILFGLFVILSFCIRGILVETARRKAKGLSKLGAIRPEVASRLSPLPSSDTSLA
ncbi:MAG: signal peptidase I [Clostridiales bacterium]|nr:signal peptidase I [Clostridiales bacterium]